jgi:hypothetical protein
MARKTKAEKETAAAEKAAASEAAAKAQAIQDEQDRQPLDQDFICRARHALNEIGHDLLASCPKSKKRTAMAKSLAAAGKALGKG